MLNIRSKRSSIWGVYTFILIFLSGLISLVNAEEAPMVYTNLSDFSKLSVEDNYFELEILNLNTNKDEITRDRFKEVTLNGIQYFVSTDRPGIKWLYLHSSDLAVLYSQSRKEYLFFGYKGNQGQKVEGLFFPRNATATSYLTEGKTKYSAENLGNLNLNEPWVEGVEGYGIGEKIRFGNASCSGIYFFNGYVSFEKPELYTKNSRVKTLKIRDLTNNVERIIDIHDTPDPQYISLGDVIPRTIEIEILEVYPGTHYKDTCINCIIISGIYEDE